MTQLALSIKSQMDELDVEMVAKQPSLTAAIVLCQTLSGLTDQEICGKKKIVNSEATWSRIKTGSNHFPQDNLLHLMDACGNEAPLIWLADRRGYELVEKESEWERKCRIEREEKEGLMRENALLRNLLVGKAA